MPIKVLALEGAPLVRIPFDVAAVGGGVEGRFLEVLEAEVVGLPSGLDALLVAADLQGRERAASRNGAVGRLLGELLAESFGRWVDSDLGLDLERVGVVLAGDLYARPALDRRGGSGDVRAVWRAFAERFPWVAGVAGNHDKFGVGWSESHVQVFRQEQGIYLLDGDVVELSGLRVAGVSGVVGNPRRPFRRTREAFEAEVARLAAAAPDVLVMHDGPDVAGRSLRGMPGVREMLEGVDPMLVVRGHAWWPSPLEVLANGTQVLNVDGVAFLLRRGR